MKHLALILIFGLHVLTSSTALAMGINAKSPVEIAANAAELQSKLAQERRILLAQHDSDETYLPPPKKKYRGGYRGNPRGVNPGLGLGLGLGTAGGGIYSNPSNGAYPSYGYGPGGNPYRKIEPSSGWGFCKPNC